jgi:hypothetical protein
MTPSDDRGSGYFVELERDKIDINIYKPRVSYIGIENKIDADEQPNQLSNYWKTIEGKIGYATRALVFLTPTGRESGTANGAPLFSHVISLSRLRTLASKVFRSQAPCLGQGKLDTIRGHHTENDEYEVGH